MKYSEEQAQAMLETNNTVWTMAMERSGVVKAKADTIIKNVEDIYSEMRRKSLAQANELQEE